MQLMDPMRIALRSAGSMGGCFLSLAILPAFLGGNSAAAEDTAQSVTLEGKSAQIAQDYCIDCHSGDDPEGDFLIATAAEAEASKDVEPAHWLKLINVLKTRSMPPADSERPAEKEYLSTVNELQKTLHAELRELPIPTTPIRRMNRAQYANAAQDLFQLKVEVFALPEKMARDYGYYKPATGKMPDSLKVGSRPLGKSQLIGKRLAGVAPFPQDLRAEHGFDNRGELLTLSPLLLESFLRLSKSIVESPDFGPKNVGIWSEFFATPAGWEKLSRDDQNSLLRERIQELLRIAFRRDVETKILDRYVDYAADQLAKEQDFSEVMKFVASAVLASPKFFYLNDASAASSDEASGEFALASRLSFFLWGSIPDAALLDLAANGELRKPGVLREQVQRMIDDPRSKRFCDSFPAQWLQLERIVSSVPDRQLFPDFYFAKFRASMHMMLEPLLVFETILVENRSIMELVHSDFSYRSDLLKKWYQGGRGSTPPTAIPFSRVEVDDIRQGGVITTLAAMTMTSSPTETKPITRGAWLATVLLNDPPEPPPADVPPLPNDDPELDKKTIREQLSMHRENAACAGCHNQLDPLGFAFENYDPVGRWRDSYENDLAIDVGGELFGRRFRNIEEFKQIVLAKDRLFAEAFTRHLLSYALGRALEPVDELSIADIVERSKDDGYPLRLVLQNIASSPAFLGN